MLSLCLCPIWEYQMLFLDTFNARNNQLSVDYAWSGTIIQMTPSNLPSEWRNYVVNHTNFATFRKVYLLTQVEPIDAFSRALESLPRNKNVPEKLLKDIKKEWCSGPNELQGALNWTAYDSDYFSHNNFWPHKDSSLWEPNIGYY